MIEVKALGELHGVERAAPCGIGSIKGNLGHTEGAAGIAALIKVALSLHHGVVPPSRYAEQENPRLRLADHGLRLLAEPLELPAETVHAGVSSFGLGGTNAHVVLRSAPAAPEADEAPDAAGGGLLTLSAPDRDGLQRAAAALADEIAAQPAERLAQICWSSNQIKASGRHRLAIARRRPAAGRRRPAAGGEPTSPRCARSPGWPAAWRPAGCSPGRAPSTRACRGRCPSSPPRTGTRSPTWTRRWRRTSAGRSASCCSATTTRSTRTELAQPAIFAVEYALARVLAEAGIEPGWLVGHSLGEYAAAAHAGVFDLDDACRLIVARGRLMQALPAGGAMLAVRATVGEVARGRSTTSRRSRWPPSTGRRTWCCPGPAAALDRVRRAAGGAAARRRDRWPWRTPSTRR